jgi:hypothetical protein
MSEATIIITDMDLNLERLIASHDTPGDTYPDLLAVTAYQLTTRPGDIDRTATAIDALVAEISRCRSTNHHTAPRQRPQEPTTGPYAAQVTPRGAHAHTNASGAHTAPNPAADLATAPGTGTHRATNPDVRP